MSPSSSSDFQYGAAVTTFIIMFIQPFDYDLLAPLLPSTAIAETELTIRRFRELLCDFGAYLPSDRLITFQVLLATFTARIENLRNSASNYNIATWDKVEHIRCLQGEVKIVIAEMVEHDGHELLHVDHYPHRGLPTVNGMCRVFRIIRNFIRRGLRMRQPPSIFFLIEAEAHAYFDRVRGNVAFPTNIVPSHVVEHPIPRPEPVHMNDHLRINPLLLPKYPQSIGWPWRHVDREDQKTHFYTFDAP